MSSEKSTKQSDNQLVEKPDWHPFSVWKKQILSEQEDTQNRMDLSRSTDMSGSWTLPSELS